MYNLDLIKDIERRLDYSFHNSDLLTNALTHRSFSYELRNTNISIKDYESLEFLGDAVIGLLVSEELYLRFPKKKEGHLSKIKSVLVSRKILAKLSEELGLGQFIRLGKGETKMGGKNKTAILADIFESITAAIYLDGGLSAARTFLTIQLGKTLESIEKKGFVESNFKSILQETLHKLGKPVPVYRLIYEKGPPHRLFFFTKVYLGKDEFSSGSGPTKKASEQAAALKALHILGHYPEPDNTGKK